MSRGFGQRQRDILAALYFSKVKPVLARHKAGESVADIDLNSTPFELAMCVKQMEAADQGRDSAWQHNIPTASECRATRRSLLRLQQVGAVKRVKQGHYMLTEESVTQFIVEEMLAEESVASTVASTSS